MTGDPRAYRRAITGSAFITFCLADVWSTRLASQSTLDRGSGACWLARPDIAEIVEAALLHFDAERYYLHAWVVMPNHVHVAMELAPERSLGSVLHSWKSFSAQQINRAVGRTGPVWQRGAFVKPIRSEDALRQVTEYIHLNPVRAGLIDEAHQWLYSSQSRWESGEREVRYAQWLDSPSLAVLTKSPP